MVSALMKTPTCASYHLALKNANPSPPGRPCSWYWPVNRFVVRSLNALPPRLPLLRQAQDRLRVVVFVAVERAVPVDQHAGAVELVADHVEHAVVAGVAGAPERATLVILGDRTVLVLAQATNDYRLGSATR